MHSDVWVYICCVTSPLVHFNLGRFQSEIPGGTGREGFWKCFSRGVNTLFKCIYRVVHNKSKCGCGGEMIEPLFKRGILFKQGSKSCKNYLNCWKNGTREHAEVHWRQKPNFKQYTAGDWSIWSWPALLQPIVFFLSKYFFAYVRIYCKFQLRTWTIFMNFNGKVL